MADFVYDLPIHRRAADVVAEPGITLGCWRIVECPFVADGGEVEREPRLVGLTLSGEGRLRISSRVVGWDWAARRATTTSGRVYELDDAEEIPTEAVEMVEAYVAMLVSGGSRDATDAVIAAGDAWRPVVG